jgi:DNA-binding response OmpR family regulator
METVWGRPDNGDTRTVSTHIARIRRKLGPVHRETISTVRQVGYKYVPRPAAVS